MQPIDVAARRAVRGAVSLPSGENFYEIENFCGCRRVVFVRARRRLCAEGNAWYRRFGEHEFLPAARQARGAAHAPCGGQQVRAKHGRRSAFGARGSADRAFRPRARHLRRRKSRRSRSRQNRPPHGAARLLAIRQANTASPPPKCSGKSTFW